jgi:hypothetical protein
MVGVLYILMLIVFALGLAVFAVLGRDASTFVVEQPIDETGENMMYITQALCNGLLDDKNVSPEQQQDILCFMLDNRDCLNEISFQTAYKLADIRTSGIDNWKRVARLTICK